jgi:hypothetical protein
LNITDVVEPDPWPRYGLVAKYRPFILNRIRPFLENNPHLSRYHVISDAIRIAWEASQKFKPELGFDPSTYLRHLLPNRLYDLYGIVKEDLETEMELPVSVQGEGNDARLIFDTGNLAIGAKMIGNELAYLTGVLDRIRSDADAVPRDHEDARAFLRAIVDHSERREREAIAESEQGGVVLLEARDLQADVRLFKENRLERFKPTLMTCESAIPTGYQIEGTQRQSLRPLPKLRQKLYRKPRVPTGNIDEEAELLDKLAKAAELTERDLKAVRLMRIGVIDTKIAEEIGVSQGYFSKLKPKIIEKLREGRKKLCGTETDDREVWSEINGFFDFFEGEDDD